MTLVNTYEEFPEYPEPTAKPARKRSRSGKSTSSSTSASNTVHGAFACPWPPNWKYKKQQRVLAWASDGLLQTEDERQFGYTTKDELEDLLFHENLRILMPDHEFHSWVQPYVDANKGECIWSDSPARVLGFRVRRGSRVRYIQQAKATWPGMEHEGASGLPRMRAFNDGWGLGDMSTPGSLGLRLAETLIPKNEKFWKPPYQAWQDLHEHGVAGWVDLFMRYEGDSAVCLDMNSAYPTAARSGMPAGRCVRIFNDDDAAEEAWTFGRYEWRLSDDPGVVERAKYLVLALGRHDNTGAASNWVPAPGASGEGWYTGVEVEAARNSGAFSEFVLRNGWGWEKVSSAFAEWTQRIDDEKARLKALGAAAELEYGWVKRMSVAPFGRFFMDIFATSVYKQGTVLDTPAFAQAADNGQVLTWAQQYGPYEVELQTVRSPGQRRDPTKLPHLAIHVWTQTRVKLAETMQLASEAGWEIFMCAIDGIYAKPVQRGRLIGLEMGASPGMWKQKELFDVKVTAAGTVSGVLGSGERFTKMPGVPRGDPRRSSSR